MILQGSRFGKPTGARIGAARARGAVYERPLERGGDRDGGAQDGKTAAGDDVLCLALMTPVFPDGTSTRTSNQ